MAILECHSLSKHYGPVRALNNVSLSLEKGRIVGFWPKRQCKHVIKPATSDHAHKRHAQSAV